ncbi:ATP-binding cassette domain-containing protein [Comamonas sp. Z1]|jgi:branched-chain amino acid transport system permease protein|uniref:branched-chain amino acid ABC transporter ATP-binding protein/permease n=1 Tax=Burkholderiales TaxID=80840 RepID=UPI0010F68ED8|nr:MULTISPECIES: ATP-binding cassette domain-containing protein [Burkholderiales]MCA3183497.1 ATP-binding cassette domain-containing protein [Cupriavidus sp.]MCA3192175.1 ATP-binding cassette domain-containing protein [Cupriavidus sp.]MCA3234600.1 ATP-binding cassette domain-containing protein [Cupriavidus sp.]QWE98096.1 ATP-binding cassette domain-containing protein [Cupriavidus sp. EM10]TYK71169.1 ATP-binding cassette domain-containing protein [Comamonas sp. Z1]
MNISTQPVVANPAVTRRRLALPVGLAAAGIVLLFIAPDVLPTYLVNTLIRAFLYAAVAITVDILWGYTGILTFGQSAFFGFGAYAAALTFTHVGFGPGTALMAFGIAIAGAMLVALVVGWFAFHPGASALYGSVITLVLPIVVSQLLYSGGSFTGSSSGLAGFESFDLSLEAWFRITAGFLLVITAGAWVFVRSDAGRILEAIRDNEQRCAYLGINVSRVKILLMVACGAVASCAGFLFACVQMVVAPEYAGFAFGTELLMWVALGGRGTLLGPVIGTVLLDSSTSYLSGSLPFLWKLLSGVAFVIVIVAMPQGLLPALLNAVRRWCRLGTRGSASRAKEVALRVAEPRPLAGLASVGRFALSVEDVHKRFGSLQVLRGIDFKVRPNELLSLIGPNGAGKTTLMKCIADGAERTSGTIRLNDHDILRSPPATCVALGAGRKFQNANVFESLTVAQAMRVSRTRLEPPSLLRRASVLALPDAALEVLRATGLERQLDVASRDLSHGMKQALELAMVLALEPNVLLLDEPTAGLTKAERTQIGAILLDLTRNYALCVLLVEHDLDFVHEISSRIIVLHQGQIVLDGSVEEVVNSELVREVYAGAGAPGEHA